MLIRKARFEDFPTILALNEESVAFLSAMDAERLAHLHPESEMHLVVEQEGQVFAFLLVFREHANYDSLNYQWFEARYPQFLYVDRIVVSQQCKARGLGTWLYNKVIAHARSLNIDIVTCEFDLDPPNLVSQRFHEKFGFVEISKQRVGESQKLVSLQGLKLT